MFGNNKCSTCGGSGTQNVMNSWPCDRCAGSGRNYRPGVGMNPGAPCGYCKGTGRYTGNKRVTCNTCGGSGRK